MSSVSDIKLIRTDFFLYFKTFIQIYIHMYIEFT